MRRGRFGGASKRGDQKKKGEATRSGCSVCWLYSCPCPCGCEEEKSHQEKEKEIVQSMGKRREQERRIMDQKLKQEQISGVFLCGGSVACVYNTLEGDERGSH